MRDGLRVSHCTIIQFVYKYRKGTGVNTGGLQLPLLIKVRFEGHSFHNEVEKPHKCVSGEWYIF